MAAKILSNADKAAVVLLTLGEEMAAKVMAQMGPDEVRRVGTALARLGRVDEAVASSVLLEFQTQLNTGKEGLTGDLKSAQRLLAAAAGKAPRLAGIKLADNESPLLMEVVAGFTPQALAQAMDKEHPQTIALVLAHATAPLAGSVLKSLPTDLQLEVIRRLAALSTVDGRSLMELADALREKAATAASRHGQRVLGGADKVAQLLQTLDSDSRDRLIRGTAERDLNLANAVKEKLFTFADLVKLDDHGIKELIKQVPTAAMRLALRNAPEAVAAKIYSNLSERGAAQLREDVAALPKTRLSDVEAAQSEIARMVRTLAELGKILIPNGEERYV